MNISARIEAWSKITNIRIMFDMNNSEKAQRWKRRAEAKKGKHKT